MPLLDLTAKTERERISLAALRAFFNIVERWGIRDEDARALLGGLSNGSYDKWGSVCQTPTRFTMRRHLDARRGGA